MYERFKLFSSGGIAGGIGVTVVYPIDLVKTRMQNQKNKSNYTNSWNCFTKTLRKEGIRGLYKGLKPQLIGVMPEKAIKLGVNDILNSLYKDKELTSRQLLGYNILSGGCAGLSQIIVTNPLEITKIRLQVHGELYPNKPVSLTQIISDLGIKNLYKGSRACMTRDVIFSAIYFPIYSSLRESFKKDGKINHGQQMLAGTLAGVCSSSITTPADVVKTRLQVKQNEKVYKGIFDCYSKIIRQEGYSALFKGLIPRVSRSAPQFGITLYFYEKFKDII